MEIKYYDDINTICSIVTANVIAAFSKRDVKMVLLIPSKNHISFSFWFLIWFLYLLILPDYYKII